MASYKTLSGYLIAICGNSNKTILTFLLKPCRLEYKVDRGAVDNSTRSEAAADDTGERRYRRRIFPGTEGFWDMA